MAGGYGLTAFLALGGVWTNDDEDGTGALGRAAHIGDVGRPGVLLVNVRAALRLDDDHEDGLAGPRVVEGDDGVGRELRGDDVVQVSRAEPGPQVRRQRDAEGRPHELDGEGGVLPD